MAKQSSESLSIATISVPIRPEAPSDLTEYQKQIWKAVADTKPPEWFEADTYPLLKAYCVAAERHHDISQELNLLPVSDKLAINLMRAEDMYAKQLKSLGVAMRLTQQSRYTPQAAATANKKTASGKKPWES